MTGTHGSGPPRRRAHSFEVASLLTFVLVMACPPIALRAGPLPHVSANMEKPAYWTQKIQNPHRVLMTSEEIRRMNEENLKRTDLYLCSVKALKKDWSRHELVALLEEDWQGFGNQMGVRYGKSGNLLDAAFWSQLKGNIDQESLKETNRLFFGLIIRRTDIRVFPTDEASLITAANHAFDRFQHSSISPGTLIGVYSFSRDRRWAYVQVPFIRGWIKAQDLAIAHEGGDALRYEEARERLVVTGSFVDVYSEPSLRQVAFLAQMGSTFPLLKDDPGSPYIIQIPFREPDGSLALRNGYVPKHSGVRRGFLPYTQDHVARQAFKMLHEPYGWGESGGGRDCSRFIMDIFATFGLLMPRNSKLQAAIGVNLGDVEGMPPKQKNKILDQSPPLATLFRLPGHIMVYLGKDRGRHYVIHSIWATREGGRSRPNLHRIEEVVVSDLSLGGPETRDTLLYRLTDVRFIGTDLPSPPR